MKKVIAYVLCLAMVLSMASAIFAETEKESINYVSLGSSLTFGYGFDGAYPREMKSWTGSKMEKAAWGMFGWKADKWDPEDNVYMTISETGYSNAGFDLEVEGALPNLVKKELISRGYDVTLHQLAMASLRSYDLLLFLGEDYVEDGYASKYLLGEYRLSHLVTGEKSTKEAIAIIQTSYQAALLDADLITYDLGAGDFGLGLSQSVVSGTDFDIQNVLKDDELELYNKYKTAVWNQIKLVLTNNGISADKVDSYQSLADNLTYLLVCYCKSLDTAMKWIFTNNEDATVVVMQIPNMSIDLKAEVNGVMLPVGSLTDILIGMANNYAAFLSPYASKYYYARITDDKRLPMFLDDIENYNGTVSKDLIAQMDVSTRQSSGRESILIKSMLGSVYESKEIAGRVNDKYYDEVLGAVYDGVIRVIKACYDSDDAGTIASGYSSKCNNAFAKILKEMMADIITSIRADQDYDKAIETAISKIENNETFTKEQFHMYVFASLFGGTLSHTNREGYQMMADAVFEALDSHNTGFIGRLNGMKNAVKDINTTTIDLAEFVISQAKPAIKNAVTTVQNNIKTTVKNNVNTVIKNVISGIKAIVK